MCARCSYGLKKAEIATALNDAVGDGSVLRVRYKDSISYRNPSKYARNTTHPNHANHAMRSLSAPLNVTKRILRALRQLTRTEVQLREGASAAAIAAALHQSKQLLNYNEAHLER